MSEAKPYEIGKMEVWEAYKRVKANRGAAGVDQQSLEEFEIDVRGNLYKIWNRISSGSYMPPPVKRVEIPKKSGGEEIRTSGSPQGGVVSPVLANLFLHYAFDMWMQRNCPQVPFERYADDIAIHCASQEQAQQVLEAVRQRLKACRLQLNEQKTKVVYCQDSNRQGKYEHVCFDFLGYTFRPRRAQSHSGRRFWSFLHGMLVSARL